MTPDRPLRIALLSYRSKPHCGGQGVYVRHLSRELDALTEVPSLDLYREGDPFRTPRWGEYRHWADVLEVAMMWGARSVSR